MLRKLFLILKVALFASALKWERRQGTDAYYSYIDLTLNMHDASIYCMANNASLLWINSEDENYYINDRYNGNPINCWIGLSDERQEGLWEWLDKSPIVYSKWSYGEPDGDTYQNCAVIYGWSSWYSAFCSDLFNFICKMVVPIDSCADETLNDCQQLCTDTYENYTCSCFVGYQSHVAEGQVICKDIDECSNKTLNNCQQNCTNTNGGYICTCFDGNNHTADGQVMCQG
ncbi:C-type lectin-like [Physella acuta]|uniref:C-type lectin-like n=1 Tax=Physella acuta TaxID=109671 RepID=UPI0027DE5AC2|nr:C-type lectin-like [Physella acuta]